MARHLLFGMLIRINGALIDISVTIGRDVEILIKYVAHVQLSAANVECFEQVIG